MSPRNQDRLAALMFFGPLVAGCLCYVAAFVVLGQRFGWW